MGDVFPTGYFCASRFLQPLKPEVAKKTAVVVVGCGPVGICAIASALTWSDTVYAIDMVPERLEEAARLGAKPLSGDVVAAVKAATDGRGADVVLEVVGGPEAFALCLEMVRPFGHISSVGVQAKPLTLSGPLLYGKNVTIAWGRCPVYGIFDEALQCLIKVQDQVAFLCEKQMRLEDAVEAYELFNARKEHKIILTP
ncbi:alcohol dehydrogenase GroES-like domain-containing protein [Colletotrichum truncatum]|uniref:Alcohol dehydrogenase GroES-like domain-containing protein n=1 Tax=Colletotrichum truncatum TaxID=5467 RepID=A0ACC3YQ60_COLTU|nr:alcohol dehydrogenase GroES-like domain-containing protein [Colletotrichum truncatum]KAF6796683.1 alcohol dehydrogenase GroES-like domain-containing protein [Colletotrichum truncatum]